MKLLRETRSRLKKKVLLEFLKRNKNTEYGRKYGFSEIKTIAEFQRLVPLSNYEQLRPYVDRMTGGEKNILTSDDPIFYAITSGSTGVAKLVPVTRYSQAKKRDVMDLWLYYISRDHPESFDGKVLAIVSPSDDGLTESGVPYGAESGHGYKSLPRSVKKIYALPYEIFTIRDYDARYYAILRVGIECDVTNIATMTPSTIILLCNKIEKIQDDLIRDIQEGTLKKDLNILPDTRKAIEETLKPNPKRAAELRSILKEKGRLLPKHIWPRLCLIECWKQGTVGLYLKGFPEFFGDVPVRDFGYFSSEARCSIPISDKGAGGILAVKGNFYEFIPREDIEKKEKRTLLCDQLEKGREYFIILTTPGGLYRYRIDDVIRVDEFYNKTPVIEFVQKGINVTSVTGEKLYESQVVKAVDNALDEINLGVEFFTALIQLGNISRYVFLVEFNAPLSYSKKKEFLEAVERELCLLNEEYKFNRTAQELDCPVLRIVRRGDFEKFREKKVQEGMHDGQFKIPQLTTDPNFQKNFTIEEEIFMDKPAA
ncbi:MAG: GH3 auxin-responsive promoter family protein [Candidatus Omnitrophota bacterium]